MKKRHVKSKKRRRRRRLQCYYDFIKWHVYQKATWDIRLIVSCWKNVREKAQRDLADSHLYRDIDKEIAQLEEPIDILGAKECYYNISHLCSQYYFRHMIKLRAVT